MNNALIVRNVSKTFDKFKLDNISFEVPGGSIVGVIGKNGCGKSTLLSVLMGMKESDSTDTGIVIDGVCLQTDEKEYKKKIAYVFSELPFMENISAVSIGKYYGRYYDGFNQKKYEALLKQYGLIDFPGCVRFSYPISYSLLRKYWKPCCQVKITVIQLSVIIYRNLKTTHQNFHRCRVESIIQLLHIP